MDYKGEPSTSRANEEIASPRHTAKTEEAPTPAIVGVEGAWDAMSSPSAVAQGDGSPSVNLNEWNASVSQLSAVDATSPRPPLSNPSTSRSSPRVSTDGMAAAAYPLNDGSDSPRALVALHGAAAAGSMSDDEFVDYGSMLSTPSSTTLVGVPATPPITVARNIHSDSVLQIQHLRTEYNPPPTRRNPQLHPHHEQHHRHQPPPPASGVINYGNNVHDPLNGQVGIYSAMLQGLFGQVPEEEPPGEPGPGVQPLNGEEFLTDDEDDGDYHIQAGNDSSDETGEDGEEEEEEEESETDEEDYADVDHY